MTDQAAFVGSYADFKIIRGRKVCSISIEIPIEEGGNFVAAFGMPNPAAEVPVALALLDPRRAAVVERKALPSPPVERKEWGSLSLAQQAGIRCGEQAFIRFLVETQGAKIFNADQAVIVVRDICQVKSRAELDQIEEAGMAWRRLDREFRRWMQEPSFA